MRKKSSLFYKPKPKDVPKSKRRWIILPFLWRGFKYIFMLIGFSVFFSFMLGLLFSATLFKTTDVAGTIPNEMILFYKLEGPIVEGPAKSGFDALGPQKLTLQKIITSLENAQTDDRVKAFILSARQSQLAVSQMQELRAAIQEFKNVSGKPAYIFSMSYGEAGQGLALYSLATVFDEIWMAPLGTLSINGLRLEQPYMRGLLDRLGVEPQFFQREEYKGVFENFDQKKMSDASRESMQALSNSLVKEFLKDILSERSDLTEEQDLSKLINKGYFLDVEAENLGLIDKVEYGDVLLKDLRADIGGNSKKKTPELINIANYYASFDEPVTKEHDIAVIYVQGPIMVLSDDESGNSILGNTPNSADTIASLIVGAAENKHVKSIVLRVDSPGGSPTASELIRRAVIRAKDMGKPVIVSMGSMAASGGYWVSAPADYIYALPGTLTGSIGVAGGKVSLKEFWNNIDVNWDHVGVGRNAGMYSMNEPFSESEAERINASMDRTYDMFLNIVAEGRDMKREKVRDVAKGRVWSGAQAIKRGLVDELGTLNDALDYAAEVSGYDSRKDMNVVILPKPKTPLEEIMELLKQTSGISPFLQNQTSTSLMNAFDLHSGGVGTKIMQDVNVLYNGNGVYVYEPMGRLQ